MPLGHLTEQELQGLKSGVYNANSVMQHLRAKVSHLEGLLARVQKLEGSVSVLRATISKLIEELEEKEVL